VRSALLVYAALTVPEALLIGGCRVPKGDVAGPGQVVVSAPPPRVGGRQTRLEVALRNGLRVVLEENHAVPVVAIQAWVAVGSADEPAELAGAAHFFEHLLLTGATIPAGKSQRPPGGIGREARAAGAQLTAWTSFDETVFELALATPFFGAGLDMLADALIRPAFAPADIERERKAILEEIRQGEGSASRVAAQALTAAAFGAHPYARPVMGNEASVGALTREQLRGFFKRAYVSGNVTLVVVGDFDAATAATRIAEAFTAMPRGSRLPSRVHVPGSGVPPRVTVLSRDVRDAEVSLGFRIPPISHEDIPALDLLAVILGRGTGARLTLEVVRNRQLASSARAYTFDSREAGLLVLTATPPPGRYEDAARGVLAEALRLAREPVPPDEIARARTLLERDLAYGKETASGYARRLGFFRAVAGGIEREDHYLERLRSLSAADLRAVAARHLRVSGLAVAVVLPEAAARARKDLPVRLDARLHEVLATAERRADQRSAQAEQPPSVEDVVRFVLPSGLRVLVLRDGTVPLVSVEAIWPGGLRHEDARTNGISALLAGLLPRGTKTRTAEQIASDLEGMAGTMSGFAGRNSLGLRAEFLSRSWERGLALVADCLRNPSFSDEEIDHERRILLHQLRAEEDDGGETAMRLFESTLWKKHPYRLDPLGTADAVASLTRRKLIDHYRLHYGVPGLTIAVVGDVDTTAVVAKLAALLGDAPAAAPPPEVAPVEPARDEPVEVFQFVAKDQAHVVLGFPGVAVTDPDRFALAVLAEVLAGPGGRLAVELQQKQALALRVDAFSIEGLDPGYFAVYVACGPEHLDAAVQGIRAELGRVAASGVAADELSRARRALAGTRAVGLQRRGALAAALAASEAYGQGWRAYRTAPGELAKVTEADVQRAARRIFDGKHEVVAVVRPPDTALVPKVGSGGGRTAAP
jgi:zinc protease